MCDNSRSIGLFCSKNNDMIDIDDINSSKETNDIYDETVSKFNSFYNKAKNLKSSIENYICEINKSAKRAFREMNKAFRKEHYLISRTRYKLKDELNGKIDNIKEELNNFLKRTENIISSFADISKAIESFGKLKESHIIRTWCYISEINKYNEKANNLFKEPKKTLFFSFDEDKDSINYRNYYFDGLPVPEDILFEKNDKNEVEITWKSDESLIKNYFDRDKIKYEIEVKSIVKKYEYESKEKKLILKNMDNQKQYKIHIRTVLNNSYSTWSKIETFTLENLSKKVFPKKSLFDKTPFTIGNIFAEKKEEK